MAHCLPLAMQPPAPPSPRYAHPRPSVHMHMAGSSACPGSAGGSLDTCHCHACSRAQHPHDLFQQAAATRFAVYIDCGSSGSRVHVFEYFLAPYPAYVGQAPAQCSFLVSPRVLYGPCYLASPSCLLAQPRLCGSAISIRSQCTHLSTLTLHLLRTHCYVTGQACPARAQPPRRAWSLALCPASSGRCLPGPAA